MRRRLAVTTHDRRRAARRRRGSRDGSCGNRSLDEAGAGRRLVAPHARATGLALSPSGAPRHAGCGSDPGHPFQSRLWRACRRRCRPAGRSPAATAQAAAAGVKGPECARTGTAWCWSSWPGRRARYDARAAPPAGLREPALVLIGLRGAVDVMLRRHRLRRRRPRAQVRLTARAGPSAWHAPTRDAKPFWCKAIFRGLVSRPCQAAHLPWILKAGALRAGRYRRSAMQKTVTADMLAEFAAAWNRHDIEALMSFMSDDCVFRDRGRARAMGRAGTPGARRGAHRLRRGVGGLSRRAVAQRQALGGGRPGRVRIHVHRHRRGRLQGGGRHGRRLSTFQGSGKIRVKNAFRKQRPAMPARS